MGGLGFRELQKFNIALLAKQFWRLMHCKGSLLYKVFSPKFFPNGSILEAPVKTRGSFAWRSIMQAKDLILAGSSWRVGNGQKIPIWNSKWLSEEGHRGVISPSSSYPPDCKVAELIKGTPPEWDEDKIRTIFLPYDVDAILQIPLSSRSPPDQLIWHATKNGKYSVRSGYHLLLQEEHISNPGSSRLWNSDPLWKTIWSMRVPAKFRSFLWRACHDSLPSKLGFDAQKSSGISMVRIMWFGNRRLPPCVMELPRANHIMVFSARSSSSPESCPQLLCGAGVPSGKAEP